MSRTSSAKQRWWEPRQLYTIPYHVLWYTLNDITWTEIVKKGASPCNEIPISNPIYNWFLMTLERLTINRPVLCAYLRYNLWAWLRNVFIDLFCFRTNILSTWYALISKVGKRKGPGFRRTKVTSLKHGAILAWNHFLFVKAWLLYGNMRKDKNM